jgi:hypothetical protein
MIFGVGLKGGYKAFNLAATLPSAINLLLWKPKVLPMHLMKRLLCSPKWTRDRPMVFLLCTKNQ